MVSSNSALLELDVKLCGADVSLLVVVVVVVAVVVLLLMVVV